MAFQPMQTAVPGTVADPDEYNKVVGNVNDLQERMTAIGVHTHTLPDDFRPDVASTFLQWGEDLILPNPGIPVATFVVCSGGAVNDGAASFIEVRLGISYNDGASFNWGQVARDQTGSGSTTRRGGVTAVHGYSGSPTGSIRVRAEVSVSAVDPAYWYGHMVALVVPITV